MGGYPKTVKTNAGVILLTDPNPKPENHKRYGSRQTESKWGPRHWGAWPTLETARVNR